MSLQSHHTDGSDESDVVEHDVKVCDTCGDAGREDLLSICCRCIDGAEHTYCMKMMVDEVPKGDWLCEECKSEEVKNTIRQMNGTDNLGGKYQVSNVSVRKLSGKRRAEELVSSSSFKKWSLEMITGSTRDVDCGKVNSNRQFSSDSHFGNESTEGSRSPATRPRLQSLRGQIIEHLPSSPTRVGTASSSEIINSVEQKSIDNSSKLVKSKESVILVDGTKENTMGLNPGSSSGSCQNNKQTGHSAIGSVGNNESSIKTSKDVKNRDNKLKDAIEAALLKKPGIYRKNKIGDQPDEPSVPTMNPGAAIVDCVSHIRNAGSLACSDALPSNWHAKISTSSVDHFQQSNGNGYKQSLIHPAEGKHLTAGLYIHEDIALYSLSKNTHIPDREYIWQGSFEITRRGKMAEFWDGLQAHLSACASPRVFEAVNKFPHKIILNGVSRASAWPTQFQNYGVKQDNIGIYFFAKDVESYEKSYQVLLDDMIMGDLALIGSINGVELLIFPSNRLPEKSNRWNMLFFLWGVLRGNKKLHHISDNAEKNCVSEFVPSILTDTIPLAGNAGSFGSVVKDKNVDSKSKANSDLQNSLHEKAIYSSKEKISEYYKQNEPAKRSFIDLSEHNDVNGTSQTNTWNDAGGQIAEQEGILSKKQKSDLYGAGNSNAETPLFAVEKGKTQQKPVIALDLNEDISCLVGDTDDIMMTKNDVGDDVASS